jgi:MFS family permease
MTASGTGPALGPPPSPVPAWTVACAVIFTCGWGGNQFTPLLTMYRQANGYSATVVDALLGAYVLGLAPALLVGGPVSDGQGRRRTALVALVASGLGSSLLAVDSLPFLATGRLLSGIAVGLGMAAGTGWVTELTVAGGRTRASGARRASLSLTAGFAAGAGVAGVLGQWGPWPGTVPYLVHLALTLAVLAAVLRWCAETRPDGPGRALADRLRIPSVRDWRFRRLVLPMAPWVFGAAGVAYAILPQEMARRMGHWALLYATVLTVATLGAGAAVQPVARRLDHATNPRAILTSMVAVTIGIGVAAASVALDSPWCGALAAVVLGLAFGMALVAGLVEVQRLSHPDDLAALTGVYYALAYVGFLLPTALAAAGSWVRTDQELCVLAVLALACTFFIAAGRAMSPAQKRTESRGEWRAGRDTLMSESTKTLPIELNTEFGARRQDLLERWQQLKADFTRGVRPGIRVDAKPVRARHWQVPPAPVHLTDRRAEITGPADARIMINALNSGVT